MSELKFLIPDGLHIHERGFKSVLDYASKHNIKMNHVMKNDHLKAQYGNYSEYKTLFLGCYDELSRLEENELFFFKKMGCVVFELVKAELLSYLMPQENWFLEERVSSDSLSIFTKAYKENKEDLLLNMAIGMYWLDFWREEIAQHKNVLASLVFSGSLTYAKAFMYLLQNTPIKVYVLEHFFTGNDYYFEEKYTHIANNSDLKFPNVYKVYENSLSELSEQEKNRENVKALNKLRLANNKNVKQPASSSKIMFSKNKPTVLIIGQVINDFSILETNLENLNSLQVYTEVIHQLLEKTDVNVVFKAHPWERQKINIKRPLTKEFLTRKFASVNQRFIVVEEHNLSELINASDYVVGLCSQSLIEAASLGKKPIQLGKAFYGGHGFTYDYSSIEEIINLIKSDNLTGQLTLPEYAKFNQFIIISLQYHLVSIHHSGISHIARKLRVLNSIALVSNKNSGKLNPSLKPVFTEQLASNEILTYIDLELDNSAKKNRPLSQKIIDKMIFIAATEKKYKKFQRNPNVFFKDSKNSIVKFLGKTYLGK